MTSMNDKYKDVLKSFEVYDLFKEKYPSIKVIAVNGFGKYRKFGEKIRKSLKNASVEFDVRVLKLPETSGGNANYGWGIIENLACEWKQIFD